MSFFTISFILSIILTIGLIAIYPLQGVFYFFAPLENTGPHYIQKKKWYLFIFFLFSCIVWFFSNQMTLLLKYLPPHMFIYQDHFFIALLCVQFITILLSFIFWYLGFFVSPFLLFLSGILGVLFSIDSQPFLFWNAWIDLGCAVTISLLSLFIAYIAFFLFDRFIFLKIRPRNVFSNVFPWFFYGLYLMLCFCIVTVLDAFFIPIDFNIQIFLWGSCVVAGLFFVWLWSSMFRRWAYQVTDDKRGIENIFSSFKFFIANINIVFWGALEWCILLAPFSIFWLFMIEGEFSSQSQISIWLYIFLSVMSFPIIWFFSTKSEKFMGESLTILTNTRIYFIYFAMLSSLAIYIFFAIPVFPLFSLWGAIIGIAIYDRGTKIFYNKYFYKIILGWFLSAFLCGIFTSLLYRLILYFYG